MSTESNARFRLAGVCATLHPFGGHLVTTASPEFEILT
jgi:hypothetical protein